MIVFVVLQKSNDEYSNKQDVGKTLFKLAWDIKELEDLKDNSVNINGLMDMLKDEAVDRVKESLASVVYVKTHSDEEEVKFTLLKRSQ